MNGPPLKRRQSPEGWLRAVVREIEIVNKKGLHARASAKFVRPPNNRRRHHRYRGHESVGGTSIMA